MITLTRLNGATFALNDQLVERIEANPDTVVVLVDGKKFIVSEPVAEVVEQIRQARADVAIRSAMVEVVEHPGPDLRLINGAKQGHHHRTMAGSAINHDESDNDPHAAVEPEHTPGHAKEGTSWIQ
jgi:flagellar protein FlbD